MAQNGAAFGITFLDKEKYGTEYDAIKNKPARKYIILHKGYYSHLYIQWLLYLKKNEY